MAGMSWILKLCLSCTFLVSLAHDCTFDGVCAKDGKGSPEVMASQCEPSSAVRQVSSTRFYGVAACAVLFPALVFVQRTAEDGDGISSFKKEAQANEGRKVSWWVLEGGGGEVWETLGIPTEANSAVLTLYTSNDEVQGLSVHWEQFSPETLLHTLSEVARDLDPTYVPFHGVSSLPSVLAGPWCGLSKSSSGNIHAPDGEEQDRVCLLGAALIVSHLRPPPRRIPSHLVDVFSLNGAVRVHYNDSYRFEHGGSARCYTDSFRTSHCRPRSYSEAYIEGLVAAVQRREHSYYGVTDAHLYTAIEMVMGFEDLDVLVVGSVEPWYEAVCIAYRARSCTTVDYNPVQYDHPKLRSITVHELQATPAEQRPRFSAAISISSFEHDGLGRYGDPVSDTALLPMPEGECRTSDGES